MFYEQVRGNMAIILSGLFLSATDAITTVLGMELGGKELMPFAIHFLQYGYPTFVIYMMIVKAILITFSVTCFTCLQILFNDLVQGEEDNYVLYGEVIVKTFIPMSLLGSNVVSVIAVLNNFNSLYILVF
jgi:hypothetical protein